MASYRFEGKLDPIIVLELMQKAGIPDDVIARRRPAALSLYLDLLEAALAAEPRLSSRGRRPRRPRFGLPVGRPGPPDGKRPTRRPHQADGGRPLGQLPLRCLR
ncbi:MAG: hypothetical protein IPF66_10550 [Holophagales bacterium]|nr:hypothetical protein [Holophagales bacterium]